MKPEIKNLKPKTTYHSHGKLLLTGEYLILQGAEAIALPAKFGQDLVVNPIETPKLFWESYDEKGRLWFENTFSLPLTKQPTNDAITNTLLQILQQAQQQNPNFLSGKQGFSVKTRLSFPRNWGLGSSSTLLNNIAQWAGVNPFLLLSNTMGGSGYDVACAGSDMPIHYQLEGVKVTVSDTPFNPVNYKENVFFIHLNKKQNSQKEVKKFLDQNNDFSREVAEISELTKRIEKATTLREFADSIKAHEEILGYVLRRIPVQKALFNDYFGQIKSLGAWGGDFILATGNEDTPKYFKKKGYETVLLYAEMVL